jgi:UDP-2,3-diacylglucosamine pyrophosphatase LpxH
MFRSRIFQTQTHPWRRHTMSRQFVISDLHLGSRGVRDNFYAGGGLKRLGSFLDYVELAGGRLIIAGDLLELWQENVGQCITANEQLLDRLAAMGATYIVGNHDVDLKAFIGTGSKWLSHSLFSTITNNVMIYINGTKTLVLHGHEGDCYCSSDTPGTGRITSIVSGILEDKAGCAVRGGDVVEDSFIGKLEWLTKLLGKTGDRNTEIIQEIDAVRLDNRADYVIAGHTHLAGKCGSWYYNAGCWCRGIDSFVHIDEDGAIGVYDWRDGQAVENTVVFGADLHGTQDNPTRHD